MISEKKVEDGQGDELSGGEMRGLAELACWTALVLAPLLYWFNGPAVSTDQFVVRAALVGVAAIGAIVLRTAALLSRRHARTTRLNMEAER